MRLSKKLLSRESAVSYIDAVSANIEDLEDMRNRGNQC